MTRDEVESDIFSECGNLPKHPQPKGSMFYIILNALFSITPSSTFPISPLMNNSDIN